MIKTFKHLRFMLVMLLAFLGVNVAFGADVYKLVNASGDLTGDFRSGALASGTYTVDGVNYTKCFKFGSSATSLGNPNDISTKYIVYEVKSTSTSIDFHVWNTNNSAQKLYIWKVEEGNTTSPTATELSIASKQSVVVNYAVSATKQTTIYVTTGSTNNMVCQIVATESGTALPRGGEVGYVMSFNKGRAAIKSATATAVDGIEYHVSSGYQLLSSSNIVIKTLGTNYVKFTLASAAKLKLTTSSTTHYFVSSSVSGTDNETEPTAKEEKEFTLDAGTWYINPNGSSVNITNIAFAAADPIEPVCPGTLTIASKDNKTAFYVGDKIELSASLTAGNGEISYQWYKGGDAIDGATSDKLTINSCTTADAGSYTCKASKPSDANCTEDAVSEALVLTVTPINWLIQATFATSTTATVSGNPGGTADVSVSSTGKLDKGKYFGIKLANNEKFQAGDKVSLHFTTAAGDNSWYVFNSKTASDDNLIHSSTTDGKSTDLSFTITSEQSAIYLVRTSDGAAPYGVWNPTLGYIKVVRPAKHDVKFAAGEGSGTMETQQVAEDFEYTIPTCTFTAPAGKEFDAWTSSDVTITDGKFIMPNKEVTLTATWKTAVTKYAVTYAKGDEAVTGAVPTQEPLAEGATFTVADKGDLAWENHVFAGWNDGTADYAAGATYTMGTADVTLTAQWKEMFTVTYMDGETTLGTEQVVDGAKAANVPAPKKELYTFAGWKDAEDNAIDFSTATISAPLTVYAQWTAWDYASSVDLAAEAAGSKTAIADFLAAANIDSKIGTKGAYDTNGLYTGYKMKNNGDYIIFNLQSGKRVKITMGYVETSVTITIDGDAQSFTTSKTEESVFTYDATADVVVKLVNNSANDKTTTLKSIEITETPAVSDDATLSSLKYGETAIDLVADKFVYNVVLPYGAAVPTVTADANHANATVGTITQATVETPTASFWVTAEDGTTKKAYQVRFAWAPKLGVEIVKATLKGGTTAPEMTGLYAGTGSAKTQGLGNGGYKLGSNDHFVTINLDGENVFAAGDIVVVGVAYLEGGNAVDLYTGSTLLGRKDVVLGDNYFEVPAGAVGENTLSIKRTSSATNPTLTYFAVQRHMPSFVAKYTIAGVEATIDQENKTITAEVPYGTDKAAAIAAAEVVAYANGSAHVAKNAGNVTVTSDYAEDGSAVYTLAITVAEHVVAKIGETKYESLQTAVDAAPAGVETLIEIVADNENGGVKVPADKNIIIDFGGFTYNATPTVGSAGTETNGFQLLKGATVTLKHGTLTSTTAKILIQNYANLTIAEDMVIDGTQSAVCGYAMSNNCGEVVIAGTVKAAEGKNAFDVCVAQSKGYEMVSVTVKETAHIDGAIEYDVWGTLPAEINSTLTVEGGEFINCAWNVEAQLAEAAKENLNVAGGTFDIAVPADYCAEGYAPAELGGGKYGVKVVHTFEGANIANDVKFEKKDAEDNLLWTMYSSDGGGLIQPTTKLFDSSTSRDCENNTDVNVTNNSRFVVVFNKEVKAVQINGYRSSTTLRNLTKVSVSATGAKNSYEDTGATIERTLSDPERGNCYTYDITDVHFEAGKYYFFEFDGTMQFYDFYYTEAAVDHQEKAITAVEIGGEALEAAELAAFVANHGATLPKTDAAFAVKVTETVSDIYDDEFVKIVATPEYNATATLDGDNNFVATLVINEETYTVSAPKMGDPVAKIGTAAFETLQEAVDAAQDGETINVVKDVENGGGVIIYAADAKDITIDFGGFTYTVAQNPVGSTGTENQGFHFEKGCNITMQNGTINTTATSGVKMLIQNYCNLTLNNLVVDGSALAGAGRYVVSNNCGNVTFKGETTITAKDGDIAFDVCKFASYEVPTVTIEDAHVTINGDVEATGGKLVMTDGTINGSIKAESGYHAGDIAISGGAFSEVVADEFCAAGFQPVTEPNAEGMYAVEVKTTVEVVTEAITWDWSKSSKAEVKGTYDNVVLNTLIPTTDDFKTEYLAISTNGQAYAVRNTSYAQVHKIHFETAAAGVITLKFSDTGNSDRQDAEAYHRYLYVNGEKTEYYSWQSSGAGDHKVVTTGNIVVEAGDVDLTFMKNGANANCNVFYVTFTPFDATIRTTTPGKLITMCQAKNIVFMDGAVAYDVEKKNPIGIDLVEATEIVAGKPYILETTKAEVRVIYGTENATEVEEEANGLVGNLSSADGNMSLPNGEGYYIFLNSHLCAASGSNGNFVAPDRAYLNYNAVEDNSAASAPGRRRITMGGLSTENATSLIDVLGAEGVQKVLIDGAIYIIREGQMYNVNGVLVK